MPRTRPEPPRGADVRPDAARGRVGRALAAALALGLASALSLSGCAPTALESAPTGDEALLDQIEQFRGRNGLYVAALPESVPDLADTAHLATVSAAAGRPTFPSLGADELRTVFASDLRDDPLWSRWYLSQLSSSVGGVLGEADVALVRGLQRSDGAFTDPAAPEGASGDAGITLMSTVTALEALQAVPGGLSPEVRRRATGWLQGAQATEAAGRSASQTLNLLRARAAVGAPVPLELAGRAARGWLSTHDVGSSPATPDDLIEAAAAARLLVRTEMPVDRQAMAAALLAAGERSADLLVRSLAAVAVRELAPELSVAALAQLDPKRSVDPRGLLNRDAEVVGNLQATYAVIRLRGEAGLAREDARLAKALAAAQPEESDLPGRVVWCAAMVSVTSADEQDDRRSDCAGSLSAQASALLPRTVTVENMWSVEALAHAMTVLGIPVGSPQLGHVSGPGAPMAKAVWSNAVSSTDPSASAQWADVEARLRSGDLRAATVFAVSAGRAGPPPRSAVSAWDQYRAAHRGGCPNGDLLFSGQDGPGKPCDLYETLNGYRMANQMIDVDGVEK